MTFKLAGWLWCEEIQYIQYALVMITGFAPVQFPLKVPNLVLETFKGKRGRTAVTITNSSPDTTRYVQIQKVFLPAMMGTDISQCGLG